MHPIVYYRPPVHVRTPKDKLHQCPECKGSGRKRFVDLWDWLFGRTQCDVCHGRLVIYRPEPPPAPPMAHETAGEYRKRIVADVDRVFDELKLTLDEWYPEQMLPEYQI